jgi:hypothetical protein
LGDLSLNADAGVPQLLDNSSVARAVVAFLRAALKPTGKRR